MGLIDMFERVLIPSRKPKRVNLKEIVCKPKGKDLIKTLRTSAVGSEYRNVDGSDRQETIQKLKQGERVRLIWDAGENGNKRTVYLVRGAKTLEFKMSDCFGRLNDKVAETVIRGLTQDNIVASAEVIKITGGTRKRPKLGCVIKLGLYQGRKK